MTENLTSTNSDNDSGSDLEDNLISDSSLPLEETESVESRIEIPEPDADNITVLTHKLPNTPILPWNRYDSPWEESEIESESDPDEPENINDSSEKNLEEREQEV